MNIAENNAAPPNPLDSASASSSSTRLRPPEEARLVLDRMRATGQVASAIADDINNAITPIAAYADALLEREALSERARHDLLRIRRAVDDAAHSASRLRELYRARAEDLQPARLPLDPLMQHAVEQRAAGPAAATGRHPAPFGARSLRVLLIDDDPSVVESLRSALSDEGHKVSTAGGGQAGIDTFRAARSAGMPFDIVITDLAMPCVDGRQVVASLRGMSPGTPIILLTGWGHQVAPGESDFKVDRLLGKPPRIRELRAALAELTTARRATDRQL